VYSYLLCFPYCFIYVYLFLFVLSVLVYGLLPPSDNSIAVNNNNNIITVVLNIRLVIEEFMQGSFIE